MVKGGSWARTSGQDLGREGKNNLSIIIDL